jgi:hypothetical protein
LPSFFEAGKGHSKGVHLLEKSMIDTIWSLLVVSDWPITMIGPSGLLLVVSHLFAVPDLVLWVGLRKSIELTRMWEIVLQGHILNDYPWGCSKHQQWCCFIIQWWV